VQFSIESGELTATMKLKRKVVEKKFAREIEELFSKA
jgi:long-chain acyl-CoA synthetase